MLRYLWLSSRAPWKGRLCAGALIALDVVMSMRQWPQLHADLAIVRCVALIFVVGGLVNLPDLAMICLVGRLPNVWQPWPGRLRNTLPQMHAQIALPRREQHEQLRCL